MGHAGAPWWPCVGIEQVVRAHDGEALVDGATLALLDLVDGGLHVVVDAPARHAAKRGKAARVGVEQHLVALTWIRHEPEGAARAQLHVRDLQPVVDAAHEQPLFAPIELERLAELEGQRHEGVDRDRLAFALAPRPDEVGDAAVAARVPGRSDLSVQGTRRAPLVPGSMGVGLERQLDRLVERGELAWLLLASVLRRALERPLQPLGYRVARQPRHARDLALRFLAPTLQSPNPADHVHGDHSSAPCLWISHIRVG